MVCVIRVFSLWLFFALTTGLHTLDQVKGKRRPIVIPPGVKLIPDTIVPEPENYNDYSRGREIIPLFNDKVPGARVAHKSPGYHLPGFDPKHPSKYPQMLLNASKYDPMHKCAPNGECTGHFMYNVWEPELIVFRPKGVQSNVGVVIAPGGGGLHLDWETEAISPAEWLNSVGITAFVLKYRVPDKDYKLHSIDGQRAMSLARHIAPKYGVNRSRIGFWASSAGGHMGINVAMADKRAYKPDDNIDDQPWNIDFMILFYPQVPTWKDYARQTNLPPVVVGYAADDPCCSARTTDMYLFDAYVVSNESVNMVVKKYIRGGHGWSDCAYYPYLLENDSPLCSFKSEFITPFFERLFGQGPWSLMESEPLMKPEQPPTDDVLQEVGAETPSLDGV